MNKNLTTVIYEIKQDDEVLDENFILVLLKILIQNWKTILLWLLMTWPFLKKTTTNEIAELQLDSEVLDNVAIDSA